MSHVQRSHTINAALAPTWAAVSKMGAVENWHPNVASEAILSVADAGIGASRRVEFQDGNSAVETVTEESALEFTTMELAEVPLLKDAKVTISTKEKGAGTTEVTFSINYGVKMGPLGWLLDAAMMKRVFGKAFESALEGLCYHLETGEFVGNTVPERS